MISLSDNLIQIVDAALASSARRAGSHLVCHPGCSPCCHGVFEITPLDAQRLREGLLQTELEDPAKATRLHVRIAAAREHLAPFFPGDPATGVLFGHEDSEQKIELFEEAFHADACPILDPATQTCDLYAHRPILCRTFGPPIRNDHEDPDAGLAVCELCFTQASDSEIAAAEMDSSFRPMEEELDQRYKAQHPHSGPTIIPFAFQQSDELS